jgi:hypothetical protein
MGNVRYGIMVLSMVLLVTATAEAQVSIGVGLPGVSIGINLPLYPQLRQIPGYPVYYAPQVSANYFFYDGMYWVFQNDNWYASAWYNGPWRVIAPQVLPYYILRVPVRYYRKPPAYFRGWQPTAPPRWNDHWGRDWSRQRSGWDQWNRQAAPKPAPLPRYQQNYPEKRYPQFEKQQKLHQQEYRYQPRSSAARDQYKGHGAPPHGKRGR